MTRHHGAQMVQQKTKADDQSEESQQPASIFPAPEAAASRYTMPVSAPSK
jgi:hypothetical protein